MALLRARSAEQEATPEALAAIRQSLGFDQGPVQLLLHWLSGLLQGMQVTLGYQGARCCLT